MDIIIKLRNRLECKINYTLLALLPNKLNITRQGLATSGVAAIGRMMIKRINALVDAKRASSFNNAIKLVNENIQITHDRYSRLFRQTHKTFQIHHLLLIYYLCLKII